MKSNYEERAKKFIAQFYPYIEACRSYHDFYEAVESFNYDFHRKVFFSYGLTRCAFITSDYVIKINYALHERNFEKFGDCDVEINTYAQAESAGFAYLFAKITEYFYQGTLFYIMPRIYGIGRTDYDAVCYLNEKEAYWVLDHVADLHSKNYGWKNKHIVIIDYACTP